MIHCNLSVLLAERRLKISRVAADTGISRTTLTALAYNNCQGIQMNTLNSLCMYLDITPDQLLSFAPVDVSVERVAGTTEKLEALFSVRDRVQTRRCTLYGRVVCTTEGQEVKNVVVDLKHGADDFDGFAGLYVALRDLPHIFISDIETALFKQIMATVLEEYAPVGKRIETGFRVVWPTNDEGQDTD
ncbi:MAG: helix-turn-helix transcriptional regulator [Clostridiales bacterium]|nr:helix-turn-helix transcriptional regulator [Clostridiales bacterium]